MKLSNFKLLKTEGKNPWDLKFHASVVVETRVGFLWLKKKVEHRMIYREFGGNWYFADTGEFTPDFQAENLARAWKATTGEQC